MLKIIIMNRKYFVDQRYWTVDAVTQIGKDPSVTSSHIIPGVQDQSDEQFARHIAETLGHGSWILSSPDE